MVVSLTTSYIKQFNENSHPKADRLKRDRKREKATWWLLTAKSSLERVSTCIAVTVSSTQLHIARMASNPYTPTSFHTS